MKQFFNLEDSMISDMELQNSLSQQMLIEFPVFALNEDYLRVLSIIIQNKIDQVKAKFHYQPEEEEEEEEKEELPRELP